ncbi:hypothetical protein AMTRI_Chr11g94910 [Amborella trichopoda]
MANSLPWWYDCAALLLALFAASLLHRYKSAKRMNLAPGPFPLPVIGNFHQLVSRLPHRALEDLSLKYGPIMFLKFGQVPTLVISSPEMAKEVLKTDELSFAQRPLFCNGKYFFNGGKDLGLSPYGMFWRQLRKMCVLELFSNKRAREIQRVREDEVAILIRSIASSTGPVNLYGLLLSLTNNVLCRAVIGDEFSERREHGGFRLAEMLDELQDILGESNIADVFPSIEWINVFTLQYWRTRNLFHLMDSFLDSVIEEHLGPTHGRIRMDFLDTLLQIKERGDMEFPLTRGIIKVLILDMFAAGTDSSLVTLTWAMFELIKNPRIMEKAQEEVRNVVGQKQSVEESDLPKLTYLKCIIKETFRLHPTVPIIARESIEECLIGGYHVPPKTRLLVNTWAIGRNEKIWENVNIFEPERFDGSNIDFRGHNFELIPFGSGRRGCPGISFAMATVELVLAQLLFFFDWELPNGAKRENLDMMERSACLMLRKSDLNLVAKPHYPIPSSIAITKPAAA